MTALKSRLSLSELNEKNTLKSVRKSSRVRVSITLQDDRYLELADSFDDSIGHAEADHDVMRPARSVEKRQGSVVVFPELLNVIQGTTRIA